MTRYKSILFRTLRRPQGPLGVWLAGHREYVGGLWEGIGELQFEYMKRCGLQPHHVFLDIGCGCLRGGVHFIRYLDKGNYLGMDREGQLISAGIRYELGAELEVRKAPEFVCSSRFAFEQFSKPPDFALAQSLFTHLNGNDLTRCLARLRSTAGKHCRFYATYFLASTAAKTPPRRSHAHGYFPYTRKEMEAFGQATGWTASYIGKWGHPRDQVMVLYTPT